MKKLNLVLAAMATMIILTGLQSCKSGSSSSKGQLFKFNLQKGKQYDYDIVLDMSTKAMGMDTKIGVGALYSLKVTDDSNHIRSILGTYRNFRMNMNLMGKSMDIDTDKPIPEVNPNDPTSAQVAMMNRMFSGIAGKSFMMKVNEEGEVLEVVGFEDVVRAMVDSMGLDEERRAAAEMSLRDQFNQDEIKKQFAQIFTIFPNKEIKVGDTWDKSYTLSGKNPAKYTTTYTVKKIEDNHVTLDSKTRIESIGEMAMTGGQEGTTVVDSQSGMVVNGDYTIDMKAKAQGVSIDMTGKSKIKGKEN